MSALARQALAPSFGFNVDHFHPIHCSSSKPRLLLLHSKPFKPCQCLSSSPHSLTSYSSPEIFLPYLQQQEQDRQSEQNPQKDDEEDEEEEEDPIDPILDFFKSQTHTKDPARLSRLSLQKNRRSSWHLKRYLNKPQKQQQLESDVENISTVKEEVQQDDSPIAGRVGEILRIAMNLPENTTLGEMLEDYKGLVSEEECVEVLEVMAEDGLLMCCLYFYEWMRLHEPSLVTPRACTVLFPVLGRAGMGDQLLVLFRNLPQDKVFRDVHVYNAAISGLFCCKRYEILLTLKW